MPVGQAIAVALGLTCAVLGYLYLSWRSQRSDRTGTALRRLFAIVGTIMTLVVGTKVVSTGVLNAPLTIGMAIFFYTRGLMFVWHFSPTTRTWVVWLNAIGSTAAFVLCAIGGVLVGGPVGFLGAAAALAYGVFWGVLLWSMVVRGGPSARSLQDDAN